MKNIDDASKILIFDKLATITQNSFFILNLHTNTMTWMSHESGERFGYASDDIKIMPTEQLIELIHPDDMPALIASMEPIQNLKDGDSVSREYRFKDSQGQFHWLRDRVVPYVRDEAGALVEVLALVTNITEQKEAELNLKQTMEKLLSSTKMAALGEMSGGIAHEINNPLTVIQARAFQLGQMVEMGKLDPEKVKQAAESISRTADKIAKIIKSLRSFAREGASDPFEVVPVRQIIEETLEFCRTRFYNHGIDVDVAPIDPELEIECRLIQIEQVLLNLLNNAFDAIRGVETKWVKISVQEEENHIEIHVTDSGAEIPEGIANQMMNPFFTTKEVGKGTSLGLSISTGIIRAHNGSLFLKKGTANTTLVMRLPRWQTPTD